MNAPIFAPVQILLQGAAIGLLFGFVLQKGRFSKFATVVNQFLFKDFRVLFTMMTAIIVGGLAVYGAIEYGMLPDVPLKASSLMGSLLGGIIFGIGMATLGFCPGTAIAALAEGARDVIFGIFGMICGAALFEMAYPWISTHILGQSSTVTLQSWFNVSHWVIFGALIAMTLALKLLFGKKISH